jgi:hypothetical protein
VSAETKPEPVIKGKVAVINGLREILTLTRSEYEDTRQGESDWPGGKLDSERGDTNPLEAAINDAAEELPGTILCNVTRLYMIGRPKDGEFVESHLYVATAILPEDGLVLSREHSAAVWLPESEYPDLNIPKKYKDAIAYGGALLDRMAELARIEAIEQPAELAA